MSLSRYLEQCYSHALLPPELHVVSNEMFLMPLARSQLSGEPGAAHVQTSWGVSSWRACLCTSPHDDMRILVGDSPANPLNGRSACSPSTLLEDGSPQS